MLKNVFAMLLALLVLTQQAQAIELPYNFKPSGGSARPTATSSTASVTFTGAADIAARDVIFVNEGTTMIFVQFGVGSASAGVPGVGVGTAGYIVPPGLAMLYQKGAGTSTIAYITASGSGSLDILPGTGQ